ncbi:hypothetical protein [Pleomorphomonas oryzae]|uniref:hypothetical protein n=1 Tax=Pleomorphomonas oryzae TaxID=261934 RepID=UPI000416CCF3|nr:hypothetical protein [Pleomorphomonas oryzae]
MAKKVESEEVLSLYRRGLQKRRIASMCGVSVETVNRRLSEAGIEETLAPLPWTAAERAIVQKAAPNPATTATSLMPLLPGRGRAGIQDKLTAARATLGMPKRGRRAAKDQPAMACLPCGDPPPGAYRDWRGVTLKFIPGVTEVRI